MSWKPRNRNISRGLLYPWLPMWLSGKESSCQCGRCGFDPWVGKISWRRKWQTTPYSYLGNHMDRGDWWAIVHEFTKGWTGRSVDMCVCVCAHTHYIYLNQCPLFPGNIAKWLLSGSYLRPCDWVFWAIECRQCNVHIWDACSIEISHIIYQLLISLITGNRTEGWGALETCFAWFLVSSLPSLRL